MEPDPHYRPADHVASFAKAVSAWLVYAVMLVAGLGLPSLWAQVNEISAMTAHAPNSSNVSRHQLCDNQPQAPRTAQKDRFG